MDEREVSWRKSSRSGTNGSYIEVAELPDRVMVRDSKLGEDSPVLTVAPAEWRSFLASVRQS